MNDVEIPGLDTLETPERVDLEVDLAGVGSRALAFILDSFLLFAVMVGSAVAFLASGAFFGSLAIVLWLLTNFLLQWFYFALFEAFWIGQTPGKRILGLRVQRVGGYPIGWSESLIRNFMRPLVDLLFFSLPVGLVVMLFTRRHQRIGDLAAGTLVVREKPILIEDLGDLGYLPEGSGTHAASGGPELSVQEFELLHDFLARRGHFDIGSRVDIARSLAALLRERLAKRGRLSSGLRGLPDEEFLQRVDAEYRGSGAQEAKPGSEGWT